jgi:hypothetical protein
MAEVVRRPALQPGRLRQLRLMPGVGRLLGEARCFTQF